MPGKVEKKLIRYLPSIFQDQENAYLEKFLSAFEKIIFHDWRPESGNDVRGFDKILNEIYRVFIPTDQHDEEFLAWLAKWVDLELDQDWKPPQRQEYISTAMDLYRKRGTVAGLKKYLQIYTGMEPEIRECRWPAGMQIGVASMIGGMSPEIDRFEKIEKQPREPEDYYVIKENDTPRTIYYYRADKVLQVSVGDDETGNRTVTIDYLLPDGNAIERKVHANVSLTRRDGLADTEYLVTGEGGTTAVYTGDTVLIGEETDIPYRFIVDVMATPERMKDVNVSRVKAIVDLEKPAHTLYYLRLIPKKVATAMQIAVHSTIAVDTIIG